MSVKQKSPILHMAEETGLYFFLVILLLVTWSSCLRFKNRPKLIFGNIY